MKRFFFLVIFLFGIIPNFAQTITNPGGSASIPNATPTAPGKSRRGEIDYVPTSEAAALKPCDASSVDTQRRRGYGNRGIDTCSLMLDGSTYAWVDEGGGVYDVTKFGASPSASATDNATYINAALSAAGTSGGKVAFPCGAFSFNATTTVAGDYTEISGQGDCTVLSYTGAGIALDFNGKQYVKLRNLKVTTSTGTIGVSLPSLSHNPKIDNITVNGFSTAGIRATSTFYGSITNSDIIYNAIGVDLYGEANGITIGSNSLRQNLIGIRIYDSGSSSQGNQVIGNTIESARASSTYAIQILGGDSNSIANNRLEYTVGTAHVYIDAGGTVADYNDLDSNHFEGTIDSIILGDSSGTGQARYTSISGGRGGVITFNSDASFTRLSAAPGAFAGTFTDNGVGTKVDTGLTYEKDSSSATIKYQLTAGGTATNLDTGSNYLDIKGAVGVHSRFETGGRLRVAQGSLTVVGDSAGFAGGVTITNGENTGVARGAGVGTVKFADGTSRDCVGFIKIYIGTTAYYMPVFAAN